MRTTALIIFGVSALLYIFCGPAYIPPSQESHTFYQKRGRGTKDIYLPTAHHHIESAHSILTSTHEELFDIEGTSDDITFTADHGHYDYKENLFTSDYVHLTAEKTP